MFSDKTTKNLFYLILFGFVIRVLFILFYRHPSYHDEDLWARLAEILLNGGGFPDHTRHPGYIVFIASVFKVFGSGNWLAVEIMQAVLSALEILLVFNLAQLVFGKKPAAWISAVIVAVYPYLIFYNAHILSESLYSFMLLLFCALLYKHLENKDSYLLPLGAGAALAGAILIKSTIMLAVPFLLIWLIANKAGYKQIAVLFLAVGLVIAPWTLRNYRVFHKFIPIAMSGSFMFQAFNSETLKNEIDTRQLKDNIKWYTDEYNEIAKLPPAEADAQYRARALKFIKENPKTALTFAKMRFTQFWRLYPITKSKVERYIGMLSSGILLPLAWTGMLLSVKYFKKSFFLIAVIACFNFAHTIFLSTLRYRLPIDPLIIIFSSFTLYLLIERIKPGICNVCENKG